MLLPVFMFGQDKETVLNKLAKAEAAKTEAEKQKQLAVDYAKANNCTAARDAKTAAETAARDAKTAARDARDARNVFEMIINDTRSQQFPEEILKSLSAEQKKEFEEATKKSRAKEDADLQEARDAVSAAEAAAQTAQTAANDATKAADGCVHKPQGPDNEKVFNDALISAEAAKKEAIEQYQLAESYVKKGKCTEARKAADAAKAAATKAEAAKAAVSEYHENSKALHDAASTASMVASLARTEADGCKDKTTPPTPPATSKITIVPTVGGGVGAAQPNATVGYCYHRDKGLVPIYENSNLTMGTTIGMEVVKGISILTGLGSVQRPRSPYASFASYRPSASGNAGPAPALPPVQVGQLNLMSLNLGVNYLHLKGEDRHPERGASFDKKMVEVLATGDFYFVNLLRAKRATKAPKVSPFLRLGAGFGIGDPNTVNGDKDTKKANFALPMGLGFRVNVSNMVSLNFDYTSRATFGDGLDGVASSTGGKDWYGAGGLGLSFLLGKKANDSDGDGVKNDDDPCPTVAGTLGGCPDTDGDGLADREDTCPNEAGDQRFGGCPDTDGDGVANNMDDCPDDAGLRRFAGCPDTDGDNIIDKEDRCPTVAGLAAINGCPDADRDGVTDDKDDCPSDPGSTEQNGCPDTDNDGIADSKDECPNIFGPGKFNGCPDTDEDGIADPKDKCPNLKGAVSNEGCPEIDAQDKAVLDKAMRNVKFRTGSAELLPASKKYLDQIAEVMSRYKGFKLSIDGYTDNEGPAASNQSLSESRARACYDYLSSIGVQTSLMTYKGHGPTNPIGDNSTEEGRLKNRRVEFTLIPQ